MLTWGQCELLMSETSKEFETVMEGKGDISDSELPNLREGDLILRNMIDESSPLYHAGVYCGNEEVIELTAPLGTKWYEKISTLFLPRPSAAVIKENVSQFLNGKLYKVFRLKHGIPEEFANSVKSAMKCNEQYDPCRNNSLQFALRLLKLQAPLLPERKTSSSSKITKASGTQSTMLTWDECELLMSETSKEFETVMEGKGDISDSELPNLREGDLILRNMIDESSPLYHAGVYCGNEEVIELTAPLGTNWYEKISTLFSSQQSVAVIKENVSHFLNGKLYKVFRLKHGIPEEFANSVKSAMKCNEQYDPCRNNSLHFALRLLKLQAKPLPERNTSSGSKVTKASGL
ncbi:uncharacterized protein LOC122331565 [Puntigrus tetrazona]|uniref:uncharacterized protein LOC122331565 n=1 Tax=Puntigrus tetrazona TaxID=1606681 RepID=UPI001C8A5F30|nr:uncharacterized protein LOC122331565 [Puntigrus tetrazona]